jgi:hypothetical protein
MRFCRKDTKNRVRKDDGHRLGRKADGLFQRRQVHLDFLRRQSRQTAQRAAHELHLCGVAQLAQHPLRNEEAEQFALRQLDGWGPPDRIGEVKAVLFVVEFQRRVPIVFQRQRRADLRMWLSRE